MFVAIAGPISNLVLAVLGLGALRVMELNGLVLGDALIARMVMEFVKFNVL